MLFHMQKVCRRSDGGVMVEVASHSKGFLFEGFELDSLFFPSFRRRKQL